MKAPDRAGSWNVEDIRIAAAQINCPVGKFRENIAKHRDYALRAARAGARIVCFPETSLSGYPESDGVPREIAQPLTGELGQAMAELSAEAGLMILAGLVESDVSGVLYNTQLVAGSGRLLGAYRKSHVGCSEIHRFSHGDHFPLFSCGKTTFGIQICYDVHFAEMSRILALRGAEVIFAPYASSDPCNPDGHASKRARWLKYQPARAFDNSLYLVAVNQVGHSGQLDFPGTTLVYDPVGEVMAEAKPMVEDLLIVDLPAAALEKKRGDALQFFTYSRRPELYGELSRPVRADV
ncbi:MAG TPA: nitrilase-related carbon-nitrogen hydrolase [Planctomycetaceae bacterium]|nr:nitrilase-related carbon-nitrogen hydrolase [Planctomycetaceae bacterium]